MSANHRITHKLSVGCLICVFLAAMLSNQPRVSAVSYKFASPGGINTGTCPYTAPCNLQRAVDTSPDGGMVFAAAGEYHPYSLPSDQVLLLTHRVYVYGGWDGVTGPDPGELDPRTHESILDGENARRGVTAVLFADFAKLDGFTIRHGNATGKYAMCTGTDPAGCGGGIFISGVSLSVENCIIEDNVATTTTSGSGIAGYGGGIYVHNPLDMNIQHNVIRSNDASTADSDPFGYTGFGGGIYVDGGLTGMDLSIQYNEISENNAAAGTASGYGAGISFNESGVKVNDNYFHDNDPNTRSLGSAIYAETSSLNILNNRFFGNRGGHVIYLHNFNGYLTSNIINNPEAEFGVYLAKNGGGRFSMLVNNIISHHLTANIGMNGGVGWGTTANIIHNTLDAAYYGIYLCEYSTVNISNSIISHNTIGIFENDGCNEITDIVNINYTLFHGNASSDGTWDNLAHPIPTGDPFYVNAAGGDYHIQANSAARDQAASAGYNYDFEGDDRPMGSGTTPYDVGADEFWWKLHFPLILKP